MRGLLLHALACAFAVSLANDALAQPATFREAALAEDPLLYYSFEEPVGSTVYEDVTGNGHDAVAVGNVDAGERLTVGRGVHINYPAGGGVGVGESYIEVPAVAGVDSLEEFTIGYVFSLDGEQLSQIEPPLNGDDFSQTIFSTRNDFQQGNTRGGYRLGYMFGRGAFLDGFPKNEWGALQIDNGNGFNPFNGSYVGMQYAETQAPLVNPVISLGAIYDPVGGGGDSVPAGDYNGNLVVDAPDYNVWRDNFGAEVDPGTVADGNENGVVDAADYNIWRDGFGTVIPPSDPAEDLVLIAGVDVDNLAPPNPGNNFEDPPVGPYTLELIEIDVVYVGEHAGGAGAGVPEPTGFALAVFSLVLVMIRRNRRCAAG